MPEKFDPAKAQWRAMKPHDLAAIMAIADQVHPTFPEDAAVFEERLRLFPRGCFVGGRDTEIAAYMISHPWRLDAPPALNSRLARIPDEPTTYYLHDIAILPVLRGHRLAAAAVDLALTRTEAERLPSLSLIAVNGSAGFWRHHGFMDVPANDALRRKLGSYGTDATFMVRLLSSTGFGQQ